MHWKFNLLSVISFSFINIHYFVSNNNQFSFSELAQHNIRTSDINYVVCTHSHADHIGNNNLFTNAEHIVGLSVQRGTIFYEDPRISNGWTY